jgi:histone-lysine N-methyltransferase SUV39H
MLREFLITTFSRNTAAVTKQNLGERSVLYTPSTVASRPGSPSLGSKKSKAPRPALSAALQAFQDIFKYSHGPKIIVENDVDDSACPPGFEFIQESIYGKGVQEPDPAFASYCTCKPGACSPENGCACMIESVEVSESESVPFELDGRVKESASKLLWECNSKCGCGSKCISKASQKGRRFALKIKRFAGKGWGVVLNQSEPIPPRTFVSTYVGEIITTTEADRRDQDWLFDLDFNTENKAKYAVDACHKGNESHFFNHSCDPNMSVYMIGGNTAGGADILTLSFWSNRWIYEGDEMTFDYKGRYKPSWSTWYADQDVEMEDAEVSEDGKKRKQCLCGAKNCRKWI